MESNNGEAKIQKVKKLVSRVDISYRHGAHWGLGSFLSLQPSGTGSDPGLPRMRKELKVAKPPLKAVALTSAWLKAPHWLMI